MIDRKELKENAREAIRATKPSPVLVTLAVLAILLVTQALSLSLNGDIEAYRAMLENAQNGKFVLVEASGSTGIFPWLLTIALDMMTMVVSMGYTLYAMRVSRREQPGFGDVFDAFGRFIRVVILGFLRSILISLLSTVYVLPATMLALAIGPVTATLVCLPLFAPLFIAVYAWRLADFLLFDHPEYTAAQCLTLSRMAMKGRKWEVFKLDLSFIGWMLLSLVPFVILWVRPYMTVTLAGYYDKVIPDFWEELKNRPMPVMRVNRSPRDGGWHVPGEEDKDDERDDSDDWF